MHQRQQQLPAHTEWRTEMEAQKQQARERNRIHSRKAKQLKYINIKCTRTRRE